MANNTANMRDVAKRAGVSAGTVSRVLSNRMGRTQVSSDTRKRILDAVRELEYVPNINALRLFTRRTGVLGFIVPRFDDPNHGVFKDQHLVLIFNGIERTISREDYRILLISQDEKFVENREYLSIFRSKQLDGVFIWGAHRDQGFYRELQDHRYPHVFITTRPDCSVDDSRFFRIDYAEAARRVLGHVLDRGHRRVVWGDNPAIVTSLGEELRRGLRQALDERGLAWADAIEPRPCGFYYPDGCAFGEDLLRNRPRADAILTVSHDAARGCLDYLGRQGVRVPGDFALACCDSLVEEPSVVKIPRSCADDAALGRLAAQRLMALIAGTPGPEENLVPPLFVPGETA